jgi:hypothetical protein
MNFKFNCICIYLLLCSNIAFSNKIKLGIGFHSGISLLQYSGEKSNIMHIRNTFYPTPSLLLEYHIKNANFQTEFNYFLIGTHISYKVNEPFWRHDLKFSSNSFTSTFLNAQFYYIVIPSLRNNPKFSFAIGTGCMINPILESHDSTSFFNARNPYSNDRLSVINIVQMKPSYGITANAKLQYVLKLPYIKHPLLICLSFQKALQKNSLYEWYAQCNLNNTRFNRPLLLVNKGTWIGFGVHYVF